MKTCLRSVSIMFLLLVLLLVLGCNEDSSSDDDDDTGLDNDDDDLIAEDGDQLPGDGDESDDDDNSADGDTEDSDDDDDDDTADGDADDDDDESDGDDPDGDHEQACAPNSRECYENAVFICNTSGTGYLAPEPCGDGYFCLNGTCFEALCEPNSSLCEGMFEVKTCLSDGSGYSDPFSCGENRYCRFGACHDMVCEPETQGCVADSVAMCAEDGSAYGTPTPCGNNQYCDAGQCHDRVCAPGSHTCEGGFDRRPCLANGSGYGDVESCGENRYCAQGECLMQFCQPGVPRCTPDGLSEELCNEQGSGYEDPVPCEDDERCLAGSCLATTCTPNETVCSGNNLLTCLPSGQGYAEPVSCGETRYCRDGVCQDRLCTPNDRQCDENGQVQICNTEGSAWNAPVACDNGQYCDDGFCRVWQCIPQSAACADETHVQVCNVEGSGYEAPTSCGANRLCSEGECVAITCQAGEPSCDGDSVVYCNENGTGYLAPIPCGQTQYCMGGVCHEQICQPNEAVCQDNAVIVCNASGSAYGAPTYCGNEQYCQGGVCVNRVCVPNVATCDGDFHYHVCTSNGSGFGDSYSCGQDRYCADGECLDQTCEPGGRQCMTQTSFRQCATDGSAYLPDQPCAQNTVCLEGECLDPADVPDPAIEVAFVRPQPGVTREMTQGEDLSVLVNATMTGGTVVSVDLLVDGQVVDTDAELPWQFAFHVDEQAETGIVYELVARAHGTNNRYNDSVASYIEVRNELPQAVFTATVSGDRQVALDASASSDTETSQEALEIRWDFENDGVFDTDWSTDKVATHVYDAYGQYTIGMEIRDAVDQLDFTTRIVSFSDISYVGGQITSSTTWYGVIIVTGDIIVPNGVTLTIAAGTDVLFVYQDTQPADGVGDYGITVQSGGSLEVEGEADDGVLLSSYGDQHRTAGAWEGINAQSGSAFSCRNAIVEYCKSCVVLRGAGIVSNLEIRMAKTYGMLVASSQDVILDTLSIHHDDGDGLQVTSIGANGAITDLESYENSGSGLVVQASAHGDIDGCDVYSNGLDGATITDSTVNIAHCRIHDNARYGVNYAGQGGGSLKYSEITQNGRQGINLLMVSTTPVIQWNNIYGNSVTGGDILGMANTASTLTLTTSSAGGYHYTSVWNVPVGGKILGANLSYSESDSSSNYMSGGIASYSNTVLYSTSTAQSNHWVDLTSLQPTSIRGYVYDAVWGGSKTITISQVQYIVPNQAGIEMAASVRNTTLNARFNYWGVFPNVLDAVSLATPSLVSLQGFVGVPFDENFDRGPYIGGTTEPQDLSLSGNIYITGNVGIATGKTLTLEPGTNLRFVKHDQNADGIGDFNLTISGSLQALGTPEAPIIIDGYGESPEPNSFTVIRAQGSSCAISYTTIDNGLNNLQISNLAAALDHVTLRYAGSVGLSLGSTLAGTTLSHVTVTECAESGVTVLAGTSSFDHLSSTYNGQHGLWVNGGIAQVTLTDSTLRHNSGDGAYLVGTAAVNISYCHFGENEGPGVEVAGSVSGLLETSNISFNEREGLMMYKSNSVLPNLVVNRNNIFSNSVTAGLDIGGESTSGILYLSTTSAGGYHFSSAWTAPSGSTIYFIKASYSESDSSSNYMSGGIVDRAHTVLWTTYTAQSNYWVDLTSNHVSSVAMYVYDAVWGGQKTITGHEVIYGSETGDSVNLTAFNLGSGGTVNVRQNWWGGSLAPADSISEYPTGLTDYSSFTGIAFTVGPR